MMIEFPMLTGSQAKEVELLGEMEGWTIVRASFEVSIQMVDAELANWIFERDEYNNVLAGNIAEFEKKQMQILMLKEFLAFVENHGIINTETAEAPKLGEDPVYE